jgi:hypothetical protein
VLLSSPAPGEAAAHPPAPRAAEFLDKGSYRCDNSMSIKHIGCLLEVFRRKRCWMEVVVSRALSSGVGAIDAA